MDESTTATSNVENKVNPLALCLKPLSKTKDVIVGSTYQMAQISYDFSRTTATKVSSAVTEKVVPTVNQYMADEQGLAKIGQFTRKAAVHGLPEVLKYWVPGVVPVYNIAARSLRDVMTEDYKKVKTENEDYKQELKKLQARLDKLERKLVGGGGDVQDDVKFDREFSLGKNNQADVKFEPLVVYP